MLAILSFLYSIAIYLIGSGTFSFMIWVLSSIIFIVLFILSINYNYKLIPYSLRIVLYVITSIGLLIFFIVELLILSKFNTVPKNNLDYIIVLGAQVGPNGPEISYKYRLDAAYDYLLKNDNTICILTGNRGSNEPISEGEGGYNYLIEKGIKENRLLYEETSTDTYENIKNAVTLINEKEDNENYTCAIVTNKYHLFRGMSIAKKILNKEVDGIPAKINRFYLLNSMVREFFGVIKDIWKIL